MVATCSCGARWTGTSIAHCAACHRTFSSDSAFDMHRVDLKCVDPESMKKKDGKPKLILKERGEVEMWSHPGGFDRKTGTRS